MGITYGSFPVNWEESRSTGQFTKITRGTTKKVISGTTSPILLRFIVSSDVAHVGEITMPAGGVGPRHTERDSHKGDAVFYITEGPITFLINDTEEVFHVPAGESMFIPEGTNYQFINYTSKEVEAVFFIAPEL